MPPKIHLKLSPSREGLKLYPLQKSEKLTKKSPKKHRKLTYEEMGYIKVLDKKRWVLDPNKGIRCGTCKFLEGGYEGNKLWHCALMDKKNLVHEQGCCNNYNYDKRTIDNKFLSGKEEIKILTLTGSGKILGNKLNDIEDLVL